MEPIFMVCPRLHVKLSLVNNVLDNFYLFIDDHVELLTDEEKYSWNSYTIPDVTWTKAVERVVD